MTEEKPYDVVIMGGGLAALTLSIQLKNAKPDISILILENRKGEAPAAAHKVGESTVELGSYYLRNVLKLREYLEEHELPKHGLRFFFKNYTKEDISSRVELGPRERLPVPSHQLDRGTLENHLAKHTQSKGTVIRFGARAKDVSLNNSGHTVTYVLGGKDEQVSCRWVVDATSRVSILKKKLGFQKPMEHHTNAVWWRLKGVIDVDSWSENLKWRSFLKPGLRLLSTVHFLDKGYWLWVIPLGTKNTSIGIVADPAVHPFEEFNSYEKALKWVKENEPKAFEMLEPETKNLMDFLVLKHYAHHTQRAYSHERWGVTGEAGAFLDPFYSPGTDFIAMGNSWLSDLILRELQGEDIEVRATVYEQAYLQMVEHWIPIYQNKYLLMGNTQIMVVKIFWDWAIYWSVPALLFTNGGLTDMKVLKELFATQNSIGKKFQQLNRVMQQLFLDWMPHENEIFSKRYIDPLDMGYLREFQQGIDKQYSKEDLMSKVRSNIAILEKVAADLFRHISHQVKGTPLDMKVDPYAICLDVENKIPQPHLNGNGLDVDPEIRTDINKMWFYGKPEPVQ